MLFIYGTTRWIYNFEKRISGYPWKWTGRAYHSISNYVKKNLLSAEFIVLKKKENEDFSHKTGGRKTTGYIHTATFFQQRWNCKRIILYQNWMRDGERRKKKRKSVSTTNYLGNGKASWNLPFRCWSCSAWVSRLNFHRSPPS